MPENGAFDIHPDAKRNFDEKASILATSLTPHPQVFDDSHFPIAPHVAGSITQDDIVPESSVWSRMDHSGRESARYFQVDDHVFSLEGETYSAFRRLGESMQRTQALRDKISLDTVIELLTDWLRAARKGQSTLTATEFVLSKCPDMVSEYTVLLPLYELFIEEPFEIGRVLIRTVTEEEIDGWVAAWTKEYPEGADSFKVSGQKWKRDLQGKATATITLVAEPKRASEVARREAEDALAMLQVFSIGMLVPEARCYWTLLGSERVESFTYFILQGETVKNGQSGFYRFRNTTGSISKALLTDLKARGLDLASALLRLSKRNEFQERLLDALLMYSRAALQDGLAEKLLYILVALESLLLRDDKEAVQQNLGERIAFTIGGNVEERKRVIKVTKDAYSLRSGFMHHGADVDDLKVMEEFMLYTSVFFERMLQATDLFTTKAHFLDTLEDRKLA